MIQLGFGEDEEKVKERESALDRRPLFFLLLLLLLLLSSFHTLQWSRRRHSAGGLCSAIRRRRSRANLYFPRKSITSIQLFMFYQF